MMQTRYNRAFWLTATAAIAASAVPASAEVYLTESQALGVVLGEKAIVRREQKTLDLGQRKRLEEASGLRFPETSVTFFIATQADKPVKYAIVMNEVGKSEPITFMVGISPEGKVTEVVIMEFRENRGWEVKEKRFLNQFRGKSAKSAIRVDEDIINYTGATLSSKAVARGVKRALLLLEAFYPGEARYKLSAAKDFALPAGLQTTSMISTSDGSLGLYRQTRYAMGTHCEIRAWCSSPGKARAFFEKGFHELERLEQIFSGYREDSELSRVNRIAGDAKVAVSPEFFALAQRAIKAANQTSGTVNFAVGPLLDLWKQCETEQRWPTTSEIAKSKLLTNPENIELNSADRSIRFLVSGMKLDFGGLAKGYAAERVGRALEESGVVSALVNLGRSSIYAAKVTPDILAIQDQADSFSRIDAWPMAILNPDGQTAEATVLGPEETVSTSGTTERGYVIRGKRLSHVLNPVTGIPIGGIQSATVIVKDGVEAEIASKTLLLSQKKEQGSSFNINQLRCWVLGDLAESNA